MAAGAENDLVLAHGDVVCLRCEDNRLLRACESLSILFSLLVMSAFFYVVLAGLKFLSSLLGYPYALFQSMCRSPRGM